MNCLQHFSFLNLMLFGTQWQFIKWIAFNIYYCSYSHLVTCIIFTTFWIKYVNLFTYLRIHLCSFITSVMYYKNDNMFTTCLYLVSQCLKSIKHIMTVFHTFQLAVKYYKYSQLHIIISISQLNIVASHYTILCIFLGTFLYLSTITQVQRHKSLLSKIQINFQHIYVD